MNQQIKKTAIRYLSSLEKKGIVIDEAYIFGSSVRSTIHHDIDICIVSQSFSSNSFKNQLFLMKLRKEKEYSIEPHPFHPKDFDNPYSFLAQTIKKTGVRIK